MSVKDELGEPGPGSTVTSRELFSGDWTRPVGERME